MQCQQYAAQLGRLYEKLQKYDIEVLIVGGGEQKGAERLAINYKLPFPVLADADRSTYLSYGLDKAMLFIQRSALLVVDKRGKVNYFHKVINPMEWLSYDSLESVLEAL